MLNKISFLLILLSFKVFSATVELGFENEQYNHSYRSSDVFMPYISSGFNPIDDSELNLFFKYMYQDQYGKKHSKTESGKFKTDRDRLDFYIKGYTWKKGSYIFSPSAGFRYENWNIDYNNDNRQDKRNLELRFYPNMTYKINNQFSLYMNGFVAPVFMETKQESRKDNHYVKGNLSTQHYNGDYYQELEVLGVKYKINDKNTVWSSFYNEIKYSEHASKYERWQLRLGYDLKAMESLNINPFIRYDLYYKEECIENTKNHGLSKDKKEVRIGSALNFEVVSTINLLAEIYFQTAKVESYTGESAEDKNRMFYKLGIRKTF